MLLAVMCDEVLETNLTLVRHRLVFHSLEGGRTSRYSSAKADGIGISPAGSSICVSDPRNEVVGFVSPHSETGLDVIRTPKGASLKLIRARYLLDPDLPACNSFEVPNRVLPGTPVVSLEGASLRWELPQRSVARVAAQLA